VLKTSIGLLSFASLVPLLSLSCYKRKTQEKWASAIPEHDVIPKEAPKEVAWDSPSGLRCGLKKKKNSWYALILLKIQKISKYKKLL